jgi:hypothetical protein
MVDWMQMPYPERLRWSGVGTLAVALVLSN